MDAEYKKNLLEKMKNLSDMALKIRTKEDREMYILEKQKIVDDLLIQKQKASQV